MLGVANGHPRVAQCQQSRQVRARLSGIASASDFRAICRGQEARIRLLSPPSRVSGLLCSPMVGLD